MKANFGKICVIGLGYIGLPTASILANKGYEVIGVDVSQHVVDTINRGEIHIVENDLDILVRSAVNSGKLKAKLQPESADVFYICVPTPVKNGEKPDLSFVESAAYSLIPIIKKGDLVILESTIPPGTTDKVAKLLEKSGHKMGEDIYVVHAPERVLPGNILQEAITNDRIIGGINKKSSQVAEAFYKTFVKGNIYLTNAITAELAKLTENSFRDVNIAFANEMSIICDKLDINVWELISLANRHPRVNILNPGPGVGGHCIAVDPWFIVDAVPAEAKLIRLARETNQLKPGRVIDKVRVLAAKFKSPVVACLGLAYKPNIDDLRESPAKQIVESLLAENFAEILVSEPNVKTAKVGKIVLADTTEIVKKADIILALVAHDEYKDIDSELLKQKVIVDTCGVWR